MVRLGWVGLGWVGLGSVRFSSVRSGPAEPNRIVGLLLSDKRTRTKPYENCSCNFACVVPNRTDSCKTKHNDSWIVF